MIKAAFFDIDGTLVSFNTHRIPLSTKIAIRRLKERGIKVFIATGRHMSSINNLEDLEFDGFVTLNGSCCYDGKDKLVYKHPIPKTDVGKVLEMEENGESYPWIFVGERELSINYFNETTDQIFKMLNFPLPRQESMVKSAEQELFQLIGFFPTEKDDHVLGALKRCESMRWHPLFADLVPRGGSKSRGIAEMLDYYGFKQDECIAFGDGGNDMLMLEYAAVGVAMGNASEQVQSKADYVTTSVDEDGIFNACRYLGLLDD